MSLTEYFNLNSPITNIPDLIGFHHNNPLGISLTAQLVFILIVVAAMGVVNHQVRRRGRDQFYPALYALLGVSLVAIYYYCFQSNLVLHQIHTTIYSPDLSSLPADIANGANEASQMVRPTIGWFCYPEIVGWPWAIVSVVLLSLVIYHLMTACMQVAAQLSVDMHFTSGKPWKEWKAAIYIVLLGVLVSAIAVYYKPVAASWAFFILQIVLILFVLGKIIADAVRSHNVYFSILIGLTIYVGLLASLMLSMECLRGGIFFIVILAAFLTNAKARKKKPAQTK